MKKIQKSVRIEAPREKVWDVLFNPKTYEVWAAEFSGTAHVDTDWKEGSRAAFTDDSGEGLVGKITKNNAPEALSIEYYAVLGKDGKEETESDMAKSIIGGIETYVLTDENGATKLDVSSDMDDEHFQMMSDAWDKALAKIKEHAEK